MCNSRVSTSGKELVISREIPRTMLNTTESLIITSIPTNNSRYYLTKWSSEGHTTDNDTDKHKNRFSSFSVADLQWSG